MSQFFDQVLFRIEYCLCTVLEFLVPDPRRGPYHINGSRLHHNAPPGQRHFQSFVKSERKYALEVKNKWSETEQTLYHLANMPIIHQC